MQYSEEFKQKVLSIYGNDEGIKNSLDSGSDWVGRCIDEDSQGDFSAKEIVEAFQSMNLQPLYQKAQRKFKLQQLYEEWVDEIYRYRNQKSKK